jgi:hypothetical protein
MGPSSTIAHYRITSMLGEGGMGAVYRATDTKLNRDVAIKVLPESFAIDPDRFARFTREAQVLASLNHPNIAAIYGVEDRAIVLELVEGKTLSGPMSEDEALPLINQLIEALEYAHEKGVVHRDLKPANIQVTPEGRLKVLDFGLAKAMSDDAAASDPSSSPTLTLRATRAGMIMGTAAYMAPEQARGYKVDKRADIWAFGGIVYEMLTGRQLFAADTVSDTLAQVLTKPIVLSDVPARFRPLLERCLERDARKRLRDIGDAALVMAEPVPVAPAMSPRRSWPWMAATGTALIAACVFAWLWTRVAPAPVYRFTIEQRAAGVSPNGRLLFTTPGQPGHGGIAVRAMDDIEWRTLPGTEGAAYPFWSPDSSTIGFFADGRLRLTPIHGGALKSPAPAADARGGSWQGDAATGKILFAAGGRLQLLDLKSEKLKDLPIQYSPADLPMHTAFLPEGNGFVYVKTLDGNGVLFRSALDSADGGERLLETQAQVSFARNPHTKQWHIFYVHPRDANLLTCPIDPRTGSLQGESVVLVRSVSRSASTSTAAFDVSQNGEISWMPTSFALPIWRPAWFDRTGKVLGVIGEPGRYSSLALSPDETRVALVQGAPDGQRIWVHDLQTGANSRLSSLAGDERNAVWSPDGRNIYYVSVIDTAQRIIRQEAASKQSEVLHSVEPQLRITLQDVTPDGKHLILTAFQPGVATSGGIFRLDMTTPADSRKLERLWQLPEIGLSTHARVAPDGRSVIVTGRSVYSFQYPPSTDPPIQLRPLTVPSAWPFLSRDGRTLYMIENDALTATPLLPSSGGNGPRPGETSVLFKLLTSRRAGANIAAASRDGNRILAITTDSGELAKAQVLTDWTTLLKQ